MDPLTEITTYEEATESFKEIKQQEITVKHSLYHLDATQLKTTANTLLKVIQDSRILALKVSKDVNLLDKKQQKIRSCLDLIDSYSSCIRWSSSFHSLSIPDKCHVAHLFLALDSSLLSNLFTPLETDSHPIQVLHSQISHLETELINQFDAAINAGNDEMILDTFKLFPLVNMHNIGIDRFGGFLCGGVGNVVTEGIKGVSDKDLGHSTLLTRIYEYVASTIDKQHAIIVKIYGPFHTIPLIFKLFQYSQLQSMIIISSFIEKANITRKLGFIKLKSDYDFREFDLVLDEVCIISQKVWYFERFIKMRVGKMLEGVDVLPSFLSFVEDIRFTKDFLTLSEFHFKKQIEKALQQTATAPLNMTSISIDDTFYILKKSIERVKSCMNETLLINFIIIVSRILDVEFIPTLVKRMNSISLDLHKNAFIVLINDIESSIYFLELLQCGFNDQIKTLLEINKSLSIDLFNQVFKSKLKNIIDTCFGKYVISESEYTVLKNTTASLKFNDKYTKLTDSVSGLTPKNKTNLESIILDFITSSIEHVILDLKFNYTGVLLLDQDIRNISNTFENRDKFIRIKSIVNVLSCEKDEIEGLKGGKRVKGVDVVKILKLRVDIDAEILKVIEK